MTRVDGSRPSRLCWSLGGWSSLTATNGRTSSPSSIGAASGGWSARKRRRSTRGASCSSRAARCTRCGIPRMSLPSSLSSSARPASSTSSRRWAPWLIRRHKPCTRLRSGTVSVPIPSWSRPAGSPPGPHVAGRTPAGMTSDRSVRLIAACRPSAGRVAVGTLVGAQGLPDCAGQAVWSRGERECDCRTAKVSQELARALVSRTGRTGDAW